MRHDAKIYKRNRSLYLQCECVDNHLREQRGICGCVKENGVPKTACEYRYNVPIDAKIYTELNQGVDDDIRKLNGQIKGVQTALRTNLTPKLDYAISLINNVEQYFEDAPIEVKQRLLSLIFPEKVEFDGKSFRTKKINAVFELIDNETKQLRTTKKDTPFDVSVSVAGAGFEPTTSGL